jgi:asparagine synthase (glutamine-hydrolysing)
VGGSTVSVQFGRWNFDGKPVERDYLEKAEASIAQYGPDSAGAYSDGNISILYHALHTTKESRREVQPYVMASGAVVTWDGRLDNRPEIIRKRQDALTIDSTDVAIVAAAYEEWGTDCFGMLIGDWALSIWDPAERTLILSKDFAGPRHLHYELTSEWLVWSTVLDPLVLLAGHPFQLDENWIAGYFSTLPDYHLTPYAGIHSVPPGHFVKIQRGVTNIQKYWDFDHSKRTIYKNDSEYEEHFLQVFAHSVQRRLRSSWPVLAELSGGMDSSSIVCMSDHLLAQGRADTPRLDTISYYNDHEPNWDERPYFSKVEERRGRAGYHIDSGKYATFSPQMNGDYFSSLPGSDESSLEFERERITSVKSQGNRVLLSGIGGDECLGGVPTPIPELADLLADGRWKEMAGQIEAWSLVKRRPWTHLLLETMRGFLPSNIERRFDKENIVPWMDSHFVATHKEVFISQRPRFHVFGARPSFQANVNAFESLRREIACAIPSFVGCYVRTYPYLDRDLLEFVYSVPREQIVRPGQRRSLMRRSLTNFVPRDILDRKRKAFVVRGPMADVVAAWPWLLRVCKEMMAVPLGFVNSDQLCQTFEQVKNGREENLIMLMRVVRLELWLRDLSRRKIIEIAGALSKVKTKRSLVKTMALSVEPSEHGLAESSQLRR